MSCDNDCKACKDKCAFEKLQANDKSKINKVIGVVSAKGGVGKSYVTTLLANALAKKGYKGSVYLTRTLQDRHTSILRPSWHDYFRRWREHRAS